MYQSLKGINGLLIDLDGTLYIGDRLIDGADKLLEALKLNNKKFLILSNNSSASRSSYKQRLSRMGILIDEELIFTSTIATINYLKLNYANSIIFPVGTPDFEAELKSHGIFLNNDYGDVVVLAFDKTLTYEKIAKASKLISNGSSFIATHADILCPTENGYIPDIGTMIALLKAATSKEPKVIGKPNKEMVEMAISILALPRDQIAIVGDRLYTDMVLAQKFGLKSILVLSGETKESDLLDSSFKPDFIFNSVKEIISEM
jgi:4-nitrophenyl phosphatase